MSREMTYHRVQNDDEGASLPELIAEHALAKEMQEMIGRLFPAGYPWVCGASVQRGQVWVGIPALMGSTLRFTEHYSNVLDKNDMRQFLKKAGGQILESFKLSRVIFDVSAFEEARKHRIMDSDKRIPTWLS